MDSDFQGDSAERFFSGLTEYAFQTRLGIADPPLVTYISKMLSRFIHRDSIYCIRNPDGVRLVEVVDMLVEAQSSEGLARREVHRHIGDFTLFWSGVFPEALRSQQAEGKKDGFLDYRSHGKRAYKIASTIEADDPRPRCDVLERLSHEFDWCVEGLREVRRQWERMTA